MREEPQKRQKRVETDDKTSSRSFISPLDQRTFERANQHISVSMARIWKPAEISRMGCRRKKSFPSTLTMATRYPFQAFPCAAGYPLQTYVLCAMDPTLAECESWNHLRSTQFLCVLYPVSMFLEKKHVLGTTKRHRSIKSAFKIVNISWCLDWSMKNFANT